MTEPTRLFLLTVRGTLHDKVKGRTTHDQTAGAPQSIAGARALGDLSHVVFGPCADAGPMGGTTPDEVLFMDLWTNPQGIQDFFSNPQVGASADALFKNRMATVWTAAEGFSSLHLPPAHGHQKRYLGLLAGKVKSREQAAAAFNKSIGNSIGNARKLGFISRESFFKLDPTGKSNDFLSVDVWGDLKGMGEYYRGEMTPELLGTLTEAPMTSIWEQPATAWMEW
jgi:hypothetical protein